MKYVAHFVIASIFCLHRTALAATLSEGASPAKAQFGEAVSVSGTAALVAPLNSSGTASSGQARVFYFANAYSTAGPLTPSKTLLKSAGTNSDRFGSSLSILGTTALVGASDYIASSAQCGGAFAYRNVNSAGSTMNQTFIMLPETRQEGAGFGTSLGLDASGNTAVVGAPGATPSARPSGSGALYAFTGLQSAAASSTIAESAILYANDSSLNSNLGVSAGTWSGNAIGGAPNHSSALGAAYLWRNYAAQTGLRNFQVKFTTSDGANGDRFGEAVGLSGSPSLLTYAVVGAPRADVSSFVDRGAAYYFSTPLTTAGTVTQTAKLIASNGAANDWFGTSVAAGLNGTAPAALVGAPKNPLTANPDKRGTVYLYSGLSIASGTVEESVRITRYAPPATSHPHDRFGQSVAMQEGVMIIGQPTAAGASNPPAAAHTIRLEDIVTLNTASADRELNGYSFVSRTNWTIGSTQSNITMRLGPEASFLITLAGQSLVVGSSSTASNNRLIVDGAVNVPLARVGAELASTLNNELQVNGTLTAGQVDVWRRSILSGTGTIISPVNMTGSLRPGQSGIGTLTVSRPLTWNYSSTSPWVFDLGPGNTSDRLVLSSGLGDFLKGTGSQKRVFDFGGSTQTGTYTLVTWAGNSDFVEDDFEATNLGTGVTAMFSIVGKSLRVTIAPEVTPPPLTALETWRQTHFGYPANTGNGANDFDFDNDGIPNLLEYALGTIPTNASSRATPVMGQSAGRLTLSFTPQVVSGLTYRIQTSSNLVSWSDVTLTGLTPGTPHVWTDSILISSAPSGRRFARLLVNE